MEVDGDSLGEPLDPLLDAPVGGLVNVEADLHAPVVEVLLPVLDVSRVEMWLDLRGGPVLPLQLLPYAGQARPVNLRGDLGLSALEVLPQ